MANPKTTMAAVSQHYHDIAERYPTSTPFVVMLYGSQNYELDLPTSDVDTKTMLLPSFADFTLNQKWLSTEEVLDTGLSTVKDVRAMCQNFLKSNINFLECLYTRYFMVHGNYTRYWDFLRTHRDFVANANPHKLMHAAAGMASQKYHALEKPFESKAEVLAQYGYDPKQLHHLCRLRLFIIEYLNTHDFGYCLTPPAAQKDYLLSLKTNPIPLEDARREADFAMKSIDELIANLPFLPNPPSSREAADFLDKFCLNIMRDHIINQLYQAGGAK